MKISQKTVEKKDKIKKKEKRKPRKEKVLVVDPEITFARLLSHNEKKNRDKVLHRIKKRFLKDFEKKYDFKEDDFVVIWNGLFHAMLLSDEPLIQEELCENISALLDLFPPEHLKSALLMYKAGLRVLASKWFELDQLNMDKFLKLVRRYLSASLRCLQRCEWSLASCELYASLISGTDGIFALETPRYARHATTMQLHIMDCYLEEIAKVSAGSIPGASLAELLRPICAYLCGGEVTVLCCSARRLLIALLRQSSAGLRYLEATRAWQEMGCPEEGQEALELVSDDEDQNGDISDNCGDDSSEKPLDPRSDRVNVELPLLPVPANLLVDMLCDMLANSNSKAHERVRICLERFEKIAESLTPSVKSKKVAHTREMELFTASDELDFRGLFRKQKKKEKKSHRYG